MSRLISSVVLGQNQNFHSEGVGPTLGNPGIDRYIFNFFISPLFNQVGKLRTSSHLQLRSGQDKAKQFDTYNNTELHTE